MNLIDKIDYMLIGGGVLLLPLMLVGLIPIGISIFRIANKWHKQLDYEKRKAEEELEKLDKGIFTTHEEDVMLK